MRWDTVLFDLDGTVTDSQEGIVNSVSYALKRLGRGVPSPDMLTTFVGPPLHESFPALCGMNEEETERAIREFRIYFERYGWAENAPYAGMAGVACKPVRSGTAAGDCNVEAGGICAESFAAF
ncbi:MAG: HAD hydrolase-like protein [Oscillospiraceae bacterium]